MRLRLVPQETSIDFFSRWKIWLGISALLMIVGFGSYAIQGLNFGIDFRGGTTIRTESTQPVNVAAYREALAALELGHPAGPVRCRRPCPLAPGRTGSGHELQRRAIRGDPAHTGSCRFEEEDVGRCSCRRSRPGHHYRRAASDPAHGRQ